MRSPMPWLRSWLGLHLVRVLAMPLDHPRSLKAEHPGLDYAVMARAEVLPWCKDPELELDEERVRAAYRRGDVCVGVSEQGRPVGYVWFAFGAAPHIGGVWVQVDAFARYFYKSFVRPSHRGRQIAPELYRRASDICPRRGRILDVLAIDVDNSRSLRASLAAGHLPVGYAGFAGGLGRVLTFRSAGARRCGFEFVPEEKGARPLAAPPELPQRPSVPSLKRR